MQKVVEKLSGVNDSDICVRLLGENNVLILQKLSLEPLNLAELTSILLCTGDFNSETLNQYFLITLDLKNISNFKNTLINTKSLALY